MREVLVCPICEGKTFKPFLNCKDHTVSQETFHILECSQCQFRVTSPTPENIGDYYLSDSYISHSKKATSVLDKIYLLARSFTLKWKLKLVHNHIPKSADLTLLDYGCGTGEFLKKCKSNGWNTYGVEPSARARGQSSGTAETNIRASLDDISVSNFNIITLWHVLEHVEDLNKTIEKLKDKLSNSGTMFIAVPNHGSWDAKYYSEFWAGYDVPRHLWHFSQTNMEALLQKNDLNLIAKIPMKLDAFYISILSDKYQHKGRPAITSVLNAIFNGLKSNLSAQKNNEYSSLIYIVRK